MVFFLNFGTVFFTAMKMMKLRKAHCSPPLVNEDNSLVFISHSVPFPATGDLRALVAGNGTSWEKKPFHFLNTSDGKQIYILLRQGCFGLRAIWVDFYPKIGTKNSPKAKTWGKKLFCWALTSKCHFTQTLAFPEKVNFPMQKFPLLGWMLRLLY